MPLRPTAIAVPLVRAAAWALFALVVSGRAHAAPTLAPTALTAPFVRLPAGGYRLPDTTLAFGVTETDRCLYCHALSNFAVRDSATNRWHDVSVNAAAFRASEHRRIACTRCHVDVTAYPHRFQPARHRVDCGDACHADDAYGEPYHHGEQPREMAHSAHAKGLTDPGSDCPSCVTCHGGDPHTVPHATKAYTAEQRVKMCMDCHDDAERMRARKVDPLASVSYRASLHWAALRHGGRNAPVCEDCHDTHGVKSSRDTTSATSAPHRAALCGQKGCHAGASAAFAATGTSHPDSRVARSRPLRRERQALVWVGGLVLGLLALGTLLEAQRRFLGRSPDADRPRIEGPLVPRLSAAVRWQHGVLIASFTLLALTGLPLRFPDSAVLAALARALGGFESMRVIHRVAAVAMGLGALAHVVLAFAALVRARFRVAEAWPLLPTLRDAGDAIQTVRWWLRLRPEPPAYDRHHWREKVHYAAVLWGVPVMIASGLVLWFAESLAAKLPASALVAVTLLHADEALLAIAIVIVWHFWIVHVSPGRTHRWGTFLDGRVTREYWLTRHGREAERAGERVPDAKPGARSDG